MPSRVPMKISPLPSETLHGDHRVAFLDAHRDDAAGARVAERGQLGLLDDAVARAHDDELVVLEFLDGEERRDALAFLHRDEVGDRLAAAVGADVGDLVDLQPVRAAAVREDHDVGVRRRDEEVRDEILFARAHADAALAAAPLVAVVRDRGPLDVAGVADRDRHVFFGDQVFDAELAFLGEDLRPARVAVLLLNLAAARRRRSASRAGRSPGSPAAVRSASAARRARRGSSAARGRSAAAAACRGSPAPGSATGRTARSGRRAPRPGSSPRGSARSPRRGDRARSSGLRGCGGAPPPCAARTPCAGGRPRAGTR